MAKKHYHVRHHSRRRRNPFGVASDDVSSLLWGSVGYVAARAVPAMALPGQNSGVMGYALNGATAFAMKLLIGGPMGDKLFVGGAIATITRIVSDNLGTKIQGLSGDPSFTLGAYWNSFFAVPTVSDPYGRVAASPYPAPALPAPVTMKGPAPRGGVSSRFSTSRYA